VALSTAFSSAQQKSSSWKKKVNHHTIQESHRPAISTSNVLYEQSPSRQYRSSIPSVPFYSIYAAQFSPPRPALNGRLKMPWKTDEVIECNELPWEDNIPYGRSEVTLTKFSVEIAKIFKYQSRKLLSSTPRACPTSHQTYKVENVPRFHHSVSIITPL
jgi:hypothetical protein